jgi:hypothetical protein
MSYFFLAQIRIHDNGDYQEILKFRLNAADCNSILVKGK